MNYSSSKKYILITGAETLLERYIIEELNSKSIPLKIFFKCLKYAQRFKTNTSSLIQTKVNQPKKFTGYLNNAHTVISTLGNPTGKNTIFDICLGYKSNIQLLSEAQKSGVKKIICVADTKSHLHRNPKVLKEKNNFIYQLEKSGIDYTIVDSNDVCLNHHNFKIDSFLAQ